MVREIKPFVRTQTPGSSPFIMLRGDDDTPKGTGVVTPPVLEQPPTYGPTLSSVTPSSTDEQPSKENSSASDAPSDESATTPERNLEMPGESGEEKTRTTGPDEELIPSPEDMLTSVEAPAPPALPEIPSPQLPK